jgi:hypothetical protein
MELNTMTNMPQVTSQQSPELVVVTHPDAQLRMNGTEVRACAGDAAPLERALAETGARLRPMFGPSEERIAAARQASAWDLPDLSVYYHAAVDGDHQAVAARLAEVPAVSGAFVKPPPAIDDHLLTAAAIAAAAPAGTPDLTAHQGYLLAAPGGVGAASVRSQPGGDGRGVQMISVGGAWRLTHEDLAGNTGGIVGGQPIDAVSFRNHGTAMLGVVRASANTFGVTGIAPGCQVRQVATFGLGTAAAIRLAADSLPAGGIIVIEWQRPGPGSTGVGAAGFIPLEWWPDDFAAIAYATLKGMIVVEPAGNGSVSLDDPLYNTPAPGFPATWRNPFNRANGDCGSILVGAGAPPPDQNNTAPDRSRMPFSNTGKSIDAQGWGAAIATLGSGDLQGGGSEDVWYTAVFGGTSGAAAMVAGVIATLQGLQLAGPKRPPLTPGDVRRLLRQSGSAQQAGPDGAATDHRIGSRPDLVALAALLTAPKDESKDSKDAKNETKENKDGKDGKDDPDKQTKDSKDGKDNKENKDAKDTPDNQIKEGKDFRDKNLKGEHGNEQPNVIPLTPGAPSALAPQRRSAEQVRHFIPGELRPELSASPLLHEPDLRGRDASELAAELRAPQVA